MLRKNLPVLLAFLKKSKLSVFLFFLMMFLAQLSLTYCLGNYNYISRYEDSFKAIPGIENSIYYAYMGDVNFQENWIKTDINTLLSGRDGLGLILNSAYISTTEYMGNAVQILALDKSLISTSLNLKLSSEGIASEGVDENHNLQIFITNDIYRDNDLGDIVTLNINGKPISSVICGRYAKTACLPNFTTGSNAVNIYDIMSDYNNTIFIINAEESMLLTQQKIYNKSNLGFIIFSENASEEEKEQICRLLAENGYTYHSYTEIEKNSREETAARFTNALPLPLFVFSLSFVFTSAIIVLIMDKNMKIFSICFLCGLNRRKGYSLILIGFAALNFTALIINIILNFFLSSSGKTSDPFYTVIFRPSDVFYMTLLAAVFLLIVGIEIYILYHGKTYVEIKKIEER